MMLDPTTPLAATLPLLAAALISAALAFLARSRPITGRAALAVFAAAFTTQALLLGIASAALSAAAAAAVFAALVFSRVLGRTNAFILPALFALLPIGQWWAFLPALLVLVAVAAVKLARSRGLRDVTTTLTHAAILTHTNGISEAGDIVDDHLNETTPRPEAPRLNVLACLSAGFLIAASIQALVLTVG